MNEIPNSQDAQDAALFPPEAAPADAPMPGTDAAAPAAAMSGTDVTAPAAAPVSAAASAPDGDSVNAAYTGPIPAAPYAYAAPSASAPEQSAPAASAAPAKKKHRVWPWIVIGSVAAACWIACCTVTAVMLVRSVGDAAAEITDGIEAAFGSYDGSGSSDYYGSSGSGGDYGSSYGIYGYDYGSGSGSSASDYDSFQDYFANAYSAAAETEIERAATGDDVTLDLQEASGEMMTYQEIYAEVSPAIVGIMTYVDGEAYGYGTAVIFTSDGYLITNEHIIDGCSACTITLSDGTEYDAKLVGSDENTDIAVLKVDAEGLPYAEFGDSDAVQVGDEVVAIGNPIGPKYAESMTNGIISGINRELDDMTLLQTNAELNNGNSGGALLNMYGQVIGITNMKIMYNYYSTVEGIGFAIPSQVVKTVADEIIANGYVSGEPALGIIAAGVTEEAQQAYDMPAGVYISEIKDASDLSNHDIQVGDVITAVNGTAVASVAEVNAIKEGFGVGDTLTLTIWRSGETFDVDIVLIDAGLVG